MKNIFTTCIMMFTMGIIYAQDIHTSLALMSPLSINPANTGHFHGDQRAFLNYKDQWRSVTTPYVTYSFSADSKILKKKISNGFLAVGLLVSRDAAGDVKMGTTSYLGSVAYGLKLGKRNLISAGIQGGAAQRSIQPDKQMWDNQYDGGAYNPAYSSGETAASENFVHGDMAGGLQWSYHSENSTLSSDDAFDARLGLSVYHLNSPQLEYHQTPEKMYARWMINGGFSLGIKNSNLAVQPDFLYGSKGGSKEFIVGTLFRYVLQEESKYTGLIKGQNAYLGVHYRSGDAVILTGMIEIANFGLGMSYDINTSKLRTASSGRGGFEISLRYINPNPFTSIRTASRI